LEQFKHRRYVPLVQAFFDTDQIENESIVHCIETIAMRTVVTLKSNDFPCSNHIYPGNVLCLLNILSDTMKSASSVLQNVPSLFIISPSR